MVSFEDRDGGGADGGGVVEITTEGGKKMDEEKAKPAIVSGEKHECPPHEWKEVSRYISWASSGPSALSLEPPPGVPFTVVDECTRCDAKRKRFEDRWKAKSS